MEERREMNGQRMMTREELEMRLPALNHIAEQRDAKFRLRYAEKTLNNGIERGYTLDAGTRVSVNVYQNERWAQMPDEELFDTLNDLDGRYCVTEDQETIGERLNAFFKSGELFEKIYPVVVSENNMESFAKAGITFDRYLDMLITYRVELMQMNDGIGTIRLQDSHLETFGISRQKIRKAAFANLEGIAPIFDNGTSLWCHAYNILAEDSYIAKPFGPKGMAPDKQLSLFRNYSWFDRDKLVGFPLEAKEILSHGNDGIRARLNVIESRIERNIGSVQRHIEKLAVGQKEPLRVKRVDTPRS